MSDPQVDPLREDFRNFVFVIWHHLGLPAPTWLQYDIAGFLQHGPDRAIIEAFRGVGKSFLTAAYVLWLLYRNVNERILVISANEERAAQFTTFCRRLLEEVPVLAHLRPRKGSRDSVLSFDVHGSVAHQSPSMRAAGITGQITGGRASVIIPDDVEVPKNSLTQLQRDRLAELVKEFDAILMSTEDLKAIGLPKGRIKFLGTPQTELTLYQTVEKRGYTLRVWPARYPADAKLRERYGPRLAPSLAKRRDEDPALGTFMGRGAPTDPDRFTDLDLLEREASYGRSGFAMQFMLDPSLSDENRYPLKLRDLLVMDLDPKMAPVELAWGSSPDLRWNDLPVVALAGDALFRPMFISKDKWADYTAIKMAIDPSGRGGDELGYAIVGMLHSRLYLLEWGGLKGGYADSNLSLLAARAKHFGVTEVVVETNFGDGMFETLLRPHLDLAKVQATIESVRSSVQKEKRIIDTLEPVLNQHRLVVDRRVVLKDSENYNEYPEETQQQYQGFFQMTRITRDKGALRKDDRIDALAIAVARWTEVLAVSAEAAAEDHRGRLMDEEIDKFLQQAGHRYLPEAGEDEFFAGRSV
jgi:hypothetical protein